MRGILLILSFLFATAAAAQAPVFDDPKGLIAHAYAPYQAGGFYEDLPELFSPTLKQLWDHMAARSEATDEPIIDFDPLVNGQDFELAELVIADPVIEGDAATVAVSFLNFGDPQELRFTLVRRAEGWKIDDIEALGEESWRLSELLAADPGGIPGPARLDRVLPERLSQLGDVALEDVHRGRGRVAGPQLVDQA